jgi:hypothetical protein
MTAELVKRQVALDEHAYEPRDIREAMVMAADLVASRLLPGGVATPEAAFAIMVTGRELGLTAMQSLRSIHIIKGRPCMSADLICALVKKSAACTRFQMIESTALRSVYATQRVGESETQMEFTIQEAQNAGLLSNDNWKKYPKAMLRARCIAALARAVYPDVVLGVYETDEISEERESSERLRYNVMPETVTVIASRGSDGSVSAFMLLVQCASSLAELSALGRKIKTASNNGEISDCHVAELKSAFAKRKEELKGAALPEAKTEAAEAAE